MCVCWYSCILPPLLSQTREEGKSVMAEVQRLRSISESQDRPLGIADLATSFDLDPEISPIT